MRFVLLAGFLATASVPALAQQADKAPNEAKVEERAAADSKDEEICKFIRVDMNSRRKQKVCMTAEEWIRFNRGN